MILSKDFRLNDKDSQVNNQSIEKPRGACMQGACGIVLHHATNIVGSFGMIVHFHGSKSPMHYDIMIDTWEL